MSEDDAIVDVRGQALWLLLYAPDEAERGAHRAAFNEFFERRARYGENFRAGVIDRMQSGYTTKVADAKPAAAPKRLLDLFAGTHSIGRAFANRGWEVVSLDWNKRRKATHTCDIRKFDKSQYPVGSFDCIWASPECTQYSIANRGPRDFETADSLVQAAIDIIRYFKPAVWWIENPASGYLKTRPVAEPLGTHHLVTYCKYYSEAEGHQAKKATALWTDCRWFTPRPICTPNARCQFMSEDASHKHKCTIEVGKCTKAQRIRIPEALCLDIEKASSEQVQANWQIRMATAAADHEREV
jgi:hypothetical protein